MQIEYSFRPEIGKVRDYFGLIGQMTKHTSISEYSAQIGLYTSPVIDDAYNKLKKQVEDVLPDCELFFSTGPRMTSFISNLLWKETRDFIEIEDVLESFKAMQPESIIFKMLAYFDEKSNYSELFYKLMSANKEMLIEYINSLHLTNKGKWDLINFITTPQPVLEKCWAAMDKIRIELEKAYVENCDFIKAFNEDIARKYELNAEDMLSEISSSSSAFIFEDGKVKTINYSTVFFIPLSIQFDRYDSLVNVYFGYEYEKGSNRIKEFKADPVSMFKAFTDDSRLNILKLLIQKELCATDISRELGIPMSSLTFHLTTLVGAEAILRRQDGKKVMYSANEEVFAQAIKFLNKLAS